MKGTWQTTDDGGGGLGVVVLIIVGAALLGPAIGAAAVAVAAAVAELVHIVLIAVAVLLGLGAAGLAAYAGVRVHRWRTGAPARVSVPAPPPWRATAAPRASRQVTSAPPPAIEQHIHHHWHGVDAADVAELIRRHGEQE
jgi:hypothetical protein